MFACVLIPFANNACSVARAYQGKRACNPHSANVDGEILIIVTKNSRMFDE